LTKLEPENELEPITTILLQLNVTFKMGL
jgi:hypothetical protein